MKGYKPLELSDKKDSSFLLELGSHSIEGGEKDSEGKDKVTVKNT